MNTLLQAVKRHRAQGVLREPGDVYAVASKDAKDLLRLGFVTTAETLPDWWGRPRRDLRLHDGVQPGPLVACVNLWQDTPAFRETVQSWVGMVDAVVVADGPYALTGHLGPSTDGLDAVLNALPVPVHQVPMPGQCWIDQVTKRTALLQAAAARYPEGTLFVVDADEFVRGDLRALPALDVGWVTMRNGSIYARRYDQPRLIRARPHLRYDARHHWLYAGDRLLATHQYGGTGVLHRAVPVEVMNVRGLNQSEARQDVKLRYLNLQHVTEHEETTGAVASDRLTGRREALHILQLTTYDPAFVAGRLHTALNATTPHASILATNPRNNPYQAPSQYDIEHDRGLIGTAWDEADVVHCHLTHQTLRDLGKRAQDKAWKVIHHHGTMYRERHEYYNVVDPAAAGLRLVSNLELLQYGHDLRWLPNPMPCAEYRRVRMGYQPGPTFRIAHSPSKRHLKGTEEFLAACDALRAKGLPIEPVLIEGKPYAESVAIKATCDAVFDSFWLGLQCAGLEGAAMGLPVIAGDAHVADLYREVVGMVPYTYANDEQAMANVIERLATDPGFREAEAERVRDYTETYHDEAAVALRYLDLLDEAFHWRVAMTKKYGLAPVPTVAKAGTLTTPLGKAPVTPQSEPLRVA